MLGSHIHFDQGYNNVENRTWKKILCSAFSVIIIIVGEPRVEEMDWIKSVGAFKRHCQRERRG